MPSTITAEKSALRRELRARLKALSPAQRQAGDDALLRRFLSLPQVEAAQTLLLYHGMGTEPDTSRMLVPLWEAGKRLCLPRCLPENTLEARLIRPDSRLVRHAYGMWEPGEDCPPVGPEEIDLALVPGLAFDRSGGRLGQGGGYYDRWLAGFSGLTVALCRKLTLLDRVPRQTHDRPVELVVTETAVYGLSPAVDGESGA